MEPSHEIQVKQTIEDPKMFFEGFRNSDKYKNAYDEFYKNKKLSPDVTEEEKINEFEKFDAAKLALFAHARQDVNFRYKSDFYSQQAQEAIKNYLGSIEDLIKMIRGGASQEQILSLDQSRNEFHQKLADTLVADHVAPNAKMGRALGRLILISKDLDTYEEASESDLKRIQRKFGF